MTDPYSMTESGCLATVREYGMLIQKQPCVNGYEGLLCLRGPVRRGNGMKTTGAGHCRPADNGQSLRDGEDFDRKLRDLRLLYEPYVYALATHFQVRLPPWIAKESWVDNWRGSFWERPGKGIRPAEKNRADHF